MSNWTSPQKRNTKQSNTEEYKSDKHQENSNRIHQQLLSELEGKKPNYEVALDNSLISLKKVQQDWYKGILDNQVSTLLSR
jgi:hypothetical protein